MTVGRLLVLEGIDGAGTTTQTERLASALRARGYEARTTREPSDGPVGRLLREMLSGAHAPVDAATLALLFAADRADHLQREIEPALARGEIVISDRYYHSSLAYQGKDEDRAWISALNERARAPDLTLILDVDPEIARARRARAGRSEELYDDRAAQARVAEGYRQIARSLGARERIRVLPGSGEPDHVASAVLEAAEALVGEV